MTESNERVASTWEDLGSIRDYRLVARLGQGGMGTVYRALHTRLGKVVAVKVLPPDMMQPDAVSRFQREMRAVGKLHHPNIVQAFDAGEHEGTHFLVMECVDGIDLHTLVKQRGPLSIADACEIIRQAAVGLQHAHQHGLVHRDVKPSNLMLSEEGQVKLLDLGLALIQGPTHPGGDLTMACQVMGTPDFVAPEQASDSHAVDIRADIYSLGCTLYYLLSGAPPYLPPEFRTPMQKITAHLSRPFPDVRRLRSDATDTLANVMEKMVAKDPANRFATPGEAASALAPLAIGGNLVRIVAPGDETQAENEPATLRPDLTRSALEDTSRPAVTTAHLASGVMPAKPASGASPLKAAIASPRRRFVPFLIATAAAAALIAAAITIIRIPTKDGTLVISVDGPGAVVTVDGETAKVALEPDGKTYRIATQPGTHTLVVTTPDGLRYKTDNQFIVEAGKETLLTARLDKATPAAKTKEVVAVTKSNFALDLSPIVDSHFAYVVLPQELKPNEPHTVEMTVVPRSIAGPKESRSLWSFDSRLALKQYGGQWEWFANTAKEESGQLISQIAVATTKSNVGQRVTLAGVSTGKEICLFVDGRHIATKPIGAFQPVQYREHVLGRRVNTSFAGWGAFDGTIDEVRISTVARYSEGYAPVERLEADKDTFALYHCDEGQGEVLTDSSGNNRHGKIVGARWTSASDSSVAIAQSKPHSPAIAPQHSVLSFDAKAGVDLPKIPLDPTKPFTIEAWIEPQEGADGTIAMCDFMALQMGRGETETKVPQFYIETVTQARGNGYRVFAAKSPPGPGPHHVAGVWNGRHAQLYLDGKPQWGDNCEPRHAVNAEFRIGKSNYRGTVGEVRISSTARYEKEFAPSARFERDASTVALYHCDEGEGDVLIDSSGNNRHGKIVGAKWASNNRPAANIVPSSTKDWTPRAIAEWTIAQGGEVWVSASKGFKKVDDLPSDFKIFRLKFDYQKSIDDEAAKVIGGFPSVGSLSLAKTSVTDAGLRHLAGLKLGALDVWGTPITGEGFDAFAGHPLDTIVLTECKISTTGWRNLAAIGKTKQWFLDKTGLNDQTAEALIATHPEIETFYAQYSSLTDVSAVRLAALPRINKLWLNGTRLTDAALKSLAQAKGLQQLEVGATKVSAAGVEALHQALPQCRIVWSGGRIEPEATRANALASGATDPDRLVARWLLEQGGSASLQRGASVVTVNPGDPLPQSSFFITTVTAPKATSADIERLVGLKYLTTVNLSKAAVDAAAVPHLAQLRSLKSLNIADTKLNTSDLADLRGLIVLNSLAIRNGQLNDHWQFLHELANLRSLRIHGRAGELERLAAFPQLRFIHFPDLTTVDDKVVGQIQKANPYIRLLVGYDKTAKALGHDPGKEAARRLISKGVVILGYPYTHYARKPLTLPEVDGELPIQVLGVTIPTGVQLSPEERQLLTCFDGSYDEFNAVGLREADAYASIVAGNGVLWGINLSESDLSDAGLSHLQRLTGLLSLDVNKTKVTAAGIQALQKALPTCKIWSSIRASAKTEPAASAAPVPTDRQVAEWAIGLKGWGQVLVDGKVLEVHDVALLPAQDFQVQKLHLDNCPVHDDDLTRLTGLKALASLHFNRTAITDTGLRHLEGLPELRILELANTQITDGAFDSLAKIKNLVHLFISGTKVTRESWPRLKELSRLGALNVSGLDFRDADLKSLVADHPRLNYLGVANSKITDAGLTSLAGLKDLKELDLRLTEVTAAGVQSLQKALPTCKIVASAK